MFTSQSMVDVSLDRHLESLSLFSVSSYKLWCKRNGFSVSTAKTADDLTAEVAHHTKVSVVDARIHKNHSPRTAEYIKRIADGEFKDQPLSSLMSWMRKLFKEVEGVPGAHDALLKLLLHVEKYADLFHTKMAFKRHGNTSRNQIIAGLAQLAIHHEHWIRPIEEWFPEKARRKHIQRFMDLAEYLFVKYEVPRMLHSAWFESDEEERRIQTGWFLHVAGGGNIRTAENLPFPLTKRAAHLFMTAVWWGRPPLEALRFVQVQAIGGGDRRNHWMLARNEYVCNRPNADFWTSIIHFFLNNPMLELSYINPIIDYIHHQKFAPRRIP